MKLKKSINQKRLKTINLLIDVCLHIIYFECQVRKNSKMASITVVSAAVKVITMGIAESLKRKKE